MADNTTTVPTAAINSSNCTSTPSTANPAVVDKYKCLLVGDADVGKTVYVRRHVTGDFTKKYQATLGLNVQPLSFCTDHGVVVFDMWDCGDLDYGLIHASMKENALVDYCADADCVILMYDCTSKQSRAGVEGWISRLNSVFGVNDDGLCKIPVIIAGNKVDRPIKGTSIRPKGNDNYYLFGVSSV